MSTGAASGGPTQAWAAANARSRFLSQRARRVLPGGVTHDVRRAAAFPVAVARAEGAHKWDLDGHEIICYVMGHGALLLGHSAMLLEGVHLFHGSGFLSAAHTEQDVDRTVAAFAASLSGLPPGLLP